MTLPLSAVLLSLLVGGCATQSSVSAPSHLPAGYTGRPFADSKYHDGPQRIPGTVMCAYYDLGGEGLAYHYNRQKNPGSGGLNPLNGDYYNEFRHDEPVGISYTKYVKQRRHPVEVCGLRFAKARLFAASGWASAEALLSKSSVGCDPCSCGILRHIDVRKPSEQQPLAPRAWNPHC